MTVRREWLNWGVFLIALGAVPLAVYWNVIDVALAQDLLRLWPLILIGLGIGLIMRFTPLAAIGGLFTAAVLGLLIGSVIAGGWTGFGGASVACRSDASVPVQTRSGDLIGAPATLDMELNCGQLTVSRQPGSGWSVTTQIADERNPVIDATGERLRLRSGDGRGGTIRRDWTVSLPQDLAVEANLTINAADASVDLGGGEVTSVDATINASDSRFALDGATRVDSVNFTVNAASSRLTLPVETRTANVNLNAASLTICVPPEAGLLIDWHGILSSQNLDTAGLQSQGNNRWSVAGTGQILMNISGNVSSFELDRSGGCQ
jgi:hypothetical protein